jgi:U4/U6.U5 tri-snRNP-associated protein 3
MSRRGGERDYSREGDRSRYDEDREDDRRGDRRGAGGGGNGRRRSRSRSYSPDDRDRRRSRDRSRSRSRSRDRDKDQASRRPGSAGGAATASAPVAVLPPPAENVELDAELSPEEIQMMMAMGIPFGFDTTQGKKVEDEAANTGAIKIKTTRTARQYMNRKVSYYFIYI